MRCAVGMLIKDGWEFKANRVSDLSTGSVWMNPAEMLSEQVLGPFQSHKGMVIKTRKSGGCAVLKKEARGTSAIITEEGDLGIQP